MKKYKEMTKRISSVLLALMICIAFMPAWVFADDEANAQGNDVSAVEQTAEEEAVEQEPEEPVVEEPVVEEPVVKDPVVEEPAEEPVVEEPVKAEEQTSTEPVQEASEMTAAAYATQDADHVHDMELIKEVKATCAATGRKAYYHCKTCDGRYIDSKGNTPVSADESNIIIPINTSAHKWDAGKITKQPAAGKSGVRTYTCLICGKTKTETVQYIGPVGKSFKLDGYQLEFKTNVVQTVPSFMVKARVPRLWLTAGKRVMTLNWNRPVSMTNVHGVIILRKTGSKTTVYKEVARFNFKNSDGSTTLKTSFIDGKASAKNTPYKYTIVTYCKRGNYTYISHCSDWAMGQTTLSNLKSVYKAKINKSTANMQYAGTTKLTLTYANPKKTFAYKNIRWYSDNPKVAKVAKGTGVVTAVKPGTTTVRGRLACGRDVTCKVSVVGAFKPKAPKLEVDIADTSSITLIWNGVKWADSYILYRSNDGVNFKTSYLVKGTTKKVTGLTKGKKYTFYIVARNVNGPYKAYSGKSGVISQKAVIKLRETDVTGFPSSKSLKAGSTLKVSIKVTYPESRKAKLQMKDGKKWTTKKTITLPSGTGTSKVNITFPNDWWDGKTQWRLQIPKNKTATAYTTGVLKVTAKRRYQNPSGYVQIQSEISKHGFSHYVSPILVDSSSTKNAHINALIKTAKKYSGNRYKQGKSGAPGKGIDESGLIMQACYGAGVDLWPVSPSTRPYNCIPKIMGSKLKKITYKPAAEGSNDYTTMTKGDLIFFSTSPNGTPIHAAIYLGLGDIIHADPIKGNVNISTIRTLEDPEGDYKYCVVGVRRIFN